MVGLNNVFKKEGDDDGVTRLHLVRQNASHPFLSVSYITPESATHTNSSTSSRRSSIELEEKQIPQSRPSLNIERDFKTSTDKKKYYEELLQASPTTEQYDPNFLDDPTIRSGRKRKVMNLPGIISSTIPFVKTKALAEELNEQFRDVHKDTITLSLSKIRRLKKRMLSAAFPNGLYNVHQYYHHGYSSSTAHLDNALIQTQTTDNQMDISTVALAIVYLEKLIIGNFVDNRNRKLIAATCLFLAAKVNSEVISAQDRTKHIQLLLEEIEDEFGVSKRAVIQHEFSTFTNLNFDLIVPLNQLLPHLKRLLEEQGIKLEEYLGEGLYDKYVMRRNIGAV
jgi:hypothetical protein